MMLITLNLGSRTTLEVYLDLAQRQRSKNWFLTPKSESSSQTLANITAYAASLHANHFVSSIRQGFGIYRRSANFT